MVWGDYRFWVYLCWEGVFFPWFLFPLCVFRECGGCVLIVLPTCSAGVFTGSICWLVLEAGGRGGFVRDPQEAFTSEKGGCSSCSTKDNPEDWFLGNRV